MAPFKGITRRGSAWRSRICHEGRQINLGTFQQLTAAARAYDRAAYKLIGQEDSKLNFPLSEGEKQELDLIGIDEFLRHVRDSLRTVKVDKKGPRLAGVRRCRNGKWSAQGGLQGRIRHMDNLDGEPEAVANNAKGLTGVGMGRSEPQGAEGKVGEDELLPPSKRVVAEVEGLKFVVALKDAQLANSNRDLEQRQREKAEELLKQQNAVHQKGTGKLIKREPSREEARESLEEKVAAMATEMEMATTQTIASEAEVGVYKRRLADSEEECSRAHASLAAVQCQLAELQQTTQKPLLECRDAVAVEVAASVTRLSEAELNVRILKDRTVDSERDLLEFLRRRAVDAEATAARLRDDLANKEQELLEQDELLASLRADKGELQQKLDRANELSIMYMDEMFEAEYRNDDLERSLDSLTKEKARLLWQLKEAKKENGVPFSKVRDSLTKERPHLLSRLPEAEIDEDDTSPKPWRSCKAARACNTSHPEATLPARC